MRLCASDPLCAEHHPIKDGLTLHGAACHACLFLPETSCERGNKYLDRSVLVSTVESSDLAFFTEFAETVPAATITAETITPPSPVETALSATDHLVDLCDERCQDFLRSWAKRGLPLPEVGYELQDENGRVCSQAELAWPDRKVAAILPEGGDHRTPFAQRGWTVFDALELARHEAQVKSLLEG